MKQQGVTLVELLMVLVIGAILLGIGVPGYGYFLGKSRLAGVTNELVGALNLARSEAIKRGVRVTLCKTAAADAADPSCDSGAGWQQGWLVFIDRGVAGIRDADDRILWVRSGATSDVSVTVTNFTHYASYLPSGVSQGADHLATGSFHLCLEGTRRSIILNRIGRIRLARGDC